MTAGELCERLEALGCKYDVMHLPSGGTVRRFTRQVNGRTLSAPFDVDDTTTIAETQIRSICHRLCLSRDQISPPAR